MAKRYRYAFAKKKVAQMGKLSTGLAAASLLLFVTAVLLSFFFEGKIWIHCRRCQSLCDVAVYIWIHNGA